MHPVHLQFIVHHRMRERGVGLQRERGLQDVFDLQLWLSLTMRRVFDPRSASIASLLLLGCASDPAPTPPVPTPSDAAADRSTGDAGSLPEPPPECDEVLPSAAMDTPLLGRRGDDLPGLLGRALRGPSERRTGNALAEPHADEPNNSSPDRTGFWPLVEVRPHRRFFVLCWPRESADRASRSLDRWRA